MWHYGSQQPPLKIASRAQFVASNEHKRAVRHSTSFPPNSVCEWPCATTEERLTHRVPRKSAGRPSAVMQGAQMLLSSFRWMSHMWHIVNLIDWQFGVEWKAKKKKKIEKGKWILITQKTPWLLLEHCCVWWSALCGSWGRAAKNDQRQGHPGVAVHLLCSVRGPSVGFLEQPCKTQHMARN